MVKFEQNSGNQILLYYKSWYLSSLILRHYTFLYKFTYKVSYSLGSLDASSQELRGKYNHDQLFITLLEWRHWIKSDPGHFLSIFFLIWFWNLSSDLHVTKIFNQPVDSVIRLPTVKFFVHYLLIMQPWIKNVDFCFSSTLNKLG